MEHKDPLIQGWMKGYKIKNFTYTQALEFALLDLASQKDHLMSEWLKHQERHATFYVSSSNMGKIKSPQSTGLVWITLFLVFSAFFLMFIADKVGVI